MEGESNNIFYINTFDSPSEDLLSSFLVPAQPVQQIFNDSEYFNKYNRCFIASLLPRPSCSAISVLGEVHGLDLSTAIGPERVKGKSN